MTAARIYIVQHAEKEPDAGDKGGVRLAKSVRRTRLVVMLVSESRDGSSIDATAPGSRNSS